VSGQDEQNLRLGRYIVTTYGEEAVRAFVPPPLPPAPPVRLESMQLLLEQANQALGRLDGLASVLPDLSLFIYAYVRKEAVLSSQIEGTQSSLSDLMLFENDEAPGVPLHDVQEVSNYVAAINHGLARLPDQGEYMATPENRISVVGQHALQDMVELQMYLEAQSQNKPWPMLPRRMDRQQEVREPYSNPVESSAVKELMDQRLIEATSGRTFVVSKSGYQFYEREMKNRIPD